MELQVEQLLEAYDKEIAKLTRRAIFAEAEVAELRKALAATQGTPEAS